MRYSTNMSAFKKVVNHSKYYAKKFHLDSLAHIPSRVIDKIKFRLDVHKIKNFKPRHVMNSAEKKNQIWKNKFIIILTSAFLFWMLFPGLVLYAVGIVFAILAVPFVIFALIEGLVSSDPAPKSTNSGHMRTQEDLNRERRAYWNGMMDAESRSHHRW